MPVDRDGGGMICMRVKRRELELSTCAVKSFGWSPLAPLCLPVSSPCDETVRGYWMLRLSVVGPEDEVRSDRALGSSTVSKNCLFPIEKSVDKSLQSSAHHIVLYFERLGVQFFATYCSGTLHRVGLSDGYVMTEAEQLTSL